MAIKTMFINHFTILIMTIVMLSNIAVAADETKKAVVSQESVIIEFQNALNEAEGKVVYVDFWASWCAPCRESFPLMNEWQEKYKNEAFKIITVNVDANKKNALQFLEKTPANFHVIYDPEGQLAQLFEVKGMPSSFIFDGNRELVSKHTGFDTFTGLRIEKEIEKLFIK